MADKKVTLTLLAKADDMIRVVKSATGTVDKELKGAELSVQSYGRAWQQAQRVGAIAARTLAVGAVAALGGVALAVNKAIDDADRINELSIQLGLGAEKLSGYGYAAKQTGTDLETLNPVFQKLTKNLAAAQDPSTRQAQLFKALNIEAKDLATGGMRNLDAVIDDVADAFKSLPDGPQKTAVALELLGKSGAGAIEFFNQGKQGLRDFSDEARAFGLIISKDTAQAADDFNDQLSKLGMAGKGFAMELATELLPHLTEFTGLIVDLVNDGALTRFAGAIGDDLVTSFRSAAEFIEKTSDAIDGFHANIMRVGDVLARFNKPTPGQLGQTNTGPDVSRLGIGLADSQRVQNLNTLLRDQGLNLDQLNEAQDRAVQGTVDLAAAMDAEGTEVTDVSEALKRYMADRNAATTAERAATDAIREQQKALQDLTRINDRAEAERAKELLQQAEAAISIEALIDGLEGEAAAILMTDEALRRLAVTREFDNLVAKAGNELTPETLARLTAERDAALAQIDLNTQVAEQHDQWIEQQRRTAEEYRGIWLNATDQLGDALTTALFDGAEAGADAIKDVMEQLARDLVQFWIRQKIIIPLQQQLMGGAGGGAGGMGSGGSLFGGMSRPGGAAGSGFLGGGTGMQMAGNALGAAAGIYGVYSNYRNGPGGLAGGLSGAAAGAMAGSMIMPGIGTIVGAIIGGLSGLFGGAKDPELRVGANGRARGAETDFTTAFGAFELGTRGENPHPAIVAGITQFDATIAEIVESMSDGEGQLEAIRDALSDWSVDLSGDAATIQNVLTSRFGEILSTFDEDTQAFVRNAGTLQEQVEALADVLSWPGQIEAALEGFRTNELLSGMTELQRQTFGVNAEFDALREQFVEMRATEAQLTELEEFRTLALGRLVIAETAVTEAIVRSAEQMSEASAILAGVANERAYAGLNSAQRAIADVNARFSDLRIALNATNPTLAEAGELERARGLALEDANALLRAQGEDLVGGLVYEESLVGMSELQQAQAGINRQFDEYIETMLDLGFALDSTEVATLNSIRATRLLRAETDNVADAAEGAAEAIAAVVEGFTRIEGNRASAGARMSWSDILGQATVGVRGDGLTEQQRAIGEVNARFDRYAADSWSAFYEALPAAMALGTDGQLTTDLNALLAQLNTLRTEAIQNIELDGLDGVTDAIDQRYQRELDWIRQLSDLRDSLLLDDTVSTLTPQERLSEAQRQYDVGKAAIAAAALTTTLDDDAVARSAFDGLSRGLLGEARDFFGSSSAYTEIFDRVLADIGALIDASPATTALQTSTTATGAIGAAPGSQPGAQTISVDVTPVTTGLGTVDASVRDQTRQLVARLESVERKLDAIATAEQAQANELRRANDARTVRTY